MTFKTEARRELESFLDSLGLPNDPKIHVNGKDHPTAVVVVDFGAPLEPVRLNPEEGQELASRIRRVTREVLNRDANIRISSDNYSGVVYWSSAEFR